MQLHRGSTRPYREDAIPDVSESPDDDAMVARRVELQETVEKLPEIVFRVYLVLQYHLQHRVSKIQVRVAGIFLHGHAVAANPPEAFDGRGALPDGVVVRERSVVVGVWGECGGGGGVFVV